MYPWVYNLKQNEVHQALFPLLWIFFILDRFFYTISHLTNNFDDMVTHFSANTMALWGDMPKPEEATLISSTVFNAMGFSFAFSFTVTLTTSAWSNIFTLWRNICAISWSITNGFPWKDNYPLRDKCDLFYLFKNSASVPLQIICSWVVARSLNSCLKMLNKKLYIFKM